MMMSPTHRLVPEAKGYVADMRVLIAEQERTDMARRLLGRSRRVPDKRSNYSGYVPKRQKKRSAYLPNS